MSFTKKNKNKSLAQIILSSLLFFLILDSFLFAQPIRY